MDAQQPPSEHDEIEQLLEASHKEQNPFRKMALTQDIFTKIKQSLIASIQSMEKNPSYLARMADFWGPRPLWQKIGIGFILTVPTLIIAIITHFIFLFVLCALTTFLYACGSIMFSNHYNYKTNTTESLTKGILGLADMLQATITALDNISQKLASEVSKFSEDNQKLKETIVLLQEQIRHLNQQLNAAIQLTASLKITQHELQDTANVLKKEAIKQQALSVAQQEELTRLNQVYSESQNRLATNLAEFAQVKSGLEKELIQVKSIVQVLSATVQEVSQMVLDDSDKQAEFKSRLDVFLTDKEASFVQIASRIAQSEEELMQTKDELKRCNSHYQNLLQKQEIQIEQLSKLIARYAPQPELIISPLNSGSFFQSSLASQEERFTNVSPRH